MKYLVIICSAVVSLSVFAGMDVNPNDTNVTPGVWCGNFPAAKAYAESNGIPLVLVWGNVYNQEECEHCAALTAQLKTVSGIQWARQQNAVFCFVSGTNGGDTSPNIGAMSFASTAGGLCPTPSAGYPYCCIYWKGYGAATFSGRSGTMYSTTGSGLLAQFENSFAEFLMKFAKRASCAIFPFGNTECDRLEAIVGQTEWIDIPVVRTNSLAEVGECKVTVACGTSNFSTNLAWNVSESRKAVRYVLPSAFSSARKATVTLSEVNGDLLASRTIIGLSEEPENSPKNPRFIGEKTAAQLGWGEWTMDMDIALDKAEAEQGAKVLVLVGGSLWCPDCYSTDRFLIDTAEFKAWAVANKIACVAIDVINPANATANTSLLTWDTGRASDRYVTCNGGLPPDESLRYQSGAGYLSRHQVSDVEAAAVAARNRWLLNTSTADGGLCRPEDLSSDNIHTGPFKTGIPCLIAMRPDGTIAGRIYQFNNISASGTDDLRAHIQRVSEMFAMAGMPEEEDNNHALTTADSIMNGAAVSASISAVDGEDVYHIVDGIGMRMTYTLNAGTNAECRLTVVDRSRDPFVTLGSVTGVADRGVVLPVKITSTNCYLTVDFAKDGSGYSMSDYFSFTNESSTVLSYTLGTDGVMSGGEFRFSQPSVIVTEGIGGAKSTSVSITVERVNGNHGAATLDVTAESPILDSRIVWADATLGWGDGDTSSKTAILTVNDNDDADGDTVVALRLGGLQAEAADAVIAEGGDRMLVYVYDDDGYGTMAFRDVDFEESAKIDGWKPGDVVSVVKISGALPPGLTCGIGDGVLVVNGVPGREGRFHVGYSVSVLRDGVVVAESKVEFAYTVKRFDFAAVIPSLESAKTYSNLSAIGADKRVFGLLTLTVPPSGRLSARLRTTERAISFSTCNWGVIDRGKAEAQASLKSSSGESIAVTIGRDGGSAVLRNSEGDFVCEFAIPAEVWSEAVQADAWAGQYTVQLPQTNVSNTVFANGLGGSAYMAMRMISPASIRRGSMLYAGLLPNGRPVYGSSVLVGNGASALMPFVHFDDQPVNGYSFSGCFVIAANAAKTWTQERWNVIEGAVTEWTAKGFGDHRGTFAVYGGYYDSASILERFQSDFDGELENFAFQVGTGGLMTGRYGPAAPSVNVKACMTVDGPELRDDVDNPNEVSLRFSPVTGVVSGELNIPLVDGGSVAAVFRGIALPGWQACAGCSPDVYVECPWADGSCSFADRVEGVSGRNGFRIKLDRE